MLAGSRGARWKWRQGALIVFGLALTGCSGPPAARQPESGVSALIGHPLPPLRTAVWPDRAALDSLPQHVVVLAFLSFDLPRSLRMLPTLAAWNDAYSRYGVKVMGVHVPAFAFAADSTLSAVNVARFGLRFPVGLDPSLELWRAFGANGETPRVIVAGADGRIEVDGEGRAVLPEAERAIRALILKTHPDLRFPAGAVPTSSGPDPEDHVAVHLGRARVADGPLRTTVSGHVTNFTAQLRYQIEGRPYTPYPVGRWIPGADGLTSAMGGAENFVALRYDGGALGAVLGLADSKPVKLWILRDDRWLPRSDAGADVEFDGRGASFVMVKEPRLYALTRASRGKHVVKLSPEEPGATIYALTFAPFASGDVRP